MNCHHSGTATLGEAIRDDHLVLRYLVMSDKLPAKRARSENPLLEPVGVSASKSLPTLDVSGDNGTAPPRMFAIRVTLIRAMTGKRLAHALVQMPRDKACSLA